ncbi:CmpA/NrtA family ABC transporter substrate-binding protein [Synechococcus elongatus]|uniref:Bicarbonate-binding protein CmpA n=1 Tax=Synechococcus elongatus (strain ATCC 33912 / PCC 7942 / FACHB-805) TaxID=1140 RepID=CMPA_SYNE7|nr:CmpA/NrtA family ABC transporter substrate-binding protein [Synechococcus elongatus]P39660.2 RecName: Full=Bicarbonate-binding protein CmpA; Flags: Precursor [Synechococcus elongatus PCC 7942 = FACHB-805]AAA03704.1 49-kD membrane protein [Synechococcus elongatus PCC 7942 = FACHB-805]ABB57518.1 membrane protein [Synechococcus elongatus PCC 7942 = FACHB-805]AJD57866.1 bicarbonate-binding protein [Synechococcus elongatus UTEX 2973]MBD2588321.1 ABC transporter substrate-binding protein [Synecho
MNEFQPVNRRQFLFTLGATAASAILLKGCGNPPSSSGGGTSSTTQPTAAGASDLEVKTIKLGYIPIFEAAPLIIGREKGFFAKYGLDVEVSKQASWAAARDNVILGSAGGGIDGGQWQMPMPALLTEGAISNGQKVPMYVLACLSTQGNGIAVSNQLKAQNLGLKLAPNRDFILNYPQTSGRKFKASYTFPNANQDFWIRYWFAAGGIDPDKDIELLTVPSAETLQNMRNGTIDCFSTGDPWPSRIAKDDIGYQAALTGQMWPYHPEEFLALRADWVDKHPKATLALLMGLMEAQQWCDQKANRAEMAKILSGRNFFNVPVSILQPILEGQIKVGADGKDLNNFDAGPLFWKSPRGSVSYPYKGLTLWFLVESIRWGFNKQVLPDIAAAQKLNDRVTREDLWQEAAKKLGVPAADIPTGSTRGTETFFDGITYNPDSPQAYLQSLKIKRA